MKNEMKTIAEITAPDLADTSKPWGIIRFIHSDGKTHEFYSCVNEMSGDRLSAFDAECPSIGDAMKWVKSVFQGVRSNATVLGFGGTKHFEI